MKIRVLLENTASLPCFRTEHGLSLLIETGSRSILFDMGQSDAFAENAEILGADLSVVDAVVLSHGHYDHGGGISKFLSVNKSAPIYLSRFAFEEHLSGTDRDVGLDKALEPNDRFVYTGDYTKIDDGIELFSCNERERKYITDPYGLNTVRDGQLIPEDFRHEQYLLFTQGRKRILFSGCSHKGILNIMDWLRPDVLIGGFHFMELDPQGDGKAVLDEASEILMKYDTVYYTCHCTGIAQYEYLKKQMKEQLNYLSAGQEIII